jgi:hypothetical protein
MDEGRTVRGNGNGGPTTPKPLIVTVKGLNWPATLGDFTLVGPVNNQGAWRWYERQCNGATHRIKVDHQLMPLFPPPPRPSMTDPSPTTAAIVQAFDDRYELLGGFDDNWQEVCIAAALRVVADNAEYLFDPQDGKVAVVRVDDILARVAELEAT